MTDATLPYGSDPAWEAGIARLRALGSPLDSFSNIGNLGMAGIRALATVPYAMASALSGGQDASGALANAATADFRGMTARDVQVNTVKAMYGPQVAAWFSSRIGPMDDPIRLWRSRPSTAATVFELTEARPGGAPMQQRPEFSAPVTRGRGVPGVTRCRGLRAHG